MAIIFTASLPDGAGQHWHTKQPHRPPLCEQMGREEMGDITWSEDAQIRGGGGGLADHVWQGSTIAEAKNRHWPITCLEKD